MTARWVIPRSPPAATRGRAGRRWSRSTSTWNEANQRPRSNRTVADNTRARPSAILRCSLRVDSWVLIVPSTGRVTCLRSGSTRMTPVVNRTAGVVFRLALNRGKATLGPLRVPARDACQFDNAAFRFARPVLYDSFEFSAHHPYRGSARLV